MKVLVCAVAIVASTLPLCAGELSVQTMDYGQNRVTTAEFSASTAPEGGAAKTALDKLTGGPDSMKAAVQATVREAKATARAHLLSKGIDPRDVRMRVRVRCTQKSLLAVRKKEEKMPAMMQSAVVGFKKEPQPDYIGKVVETCSFRLSIKRKKQAAPAQLQDFAIELPVPDQETH